MWIHKETQEWLDSLETVLEEEGVERFAHFLLESSNRGKRVVRRSAFYLLMRQPLI